MSTLTIKVGSTVDTLQICNPNDEDRPIRISNPEFEGQVLVRVNNFHGVVPPGCRPIPTSPYFEGHRRKMSFQFQGKFERAYTADDLIWSTDWDFPINVPKLMGLFTRFYSMIDPGSFNDLKSDTPYMRSYVTTAMCTIQAWPIRRPHDTEFRPILVEDINFLLPPDPTMHPHMHAHMPPTHHVPPPPSQPISPRESTTSLETSVSNLSISHPPPPRKSSLSPSPGTAPPPPRGSSLAAPPDTRDWKQINKLRGGGEEAVKERRKYFSSEENRRMTVFQPGFVYGFEVFNPYFDPNTFKIKIPGVTLDMFKVGNGQPMRTRLMTKDGKVVFFVVEVSTGGGDEDKEGDLPE
ncbi:hypothetical protein HDU97_001189 [Phlyctochytrium planicorne]|nr:hypothetical protein HDU97_001189 [Phlyctochytrium planicorne]